MTRNECIELACQIKEMGNYEGDLSGLLYSAVGMVKLSPDAGTTLAGYLLVDALASTNIQLNDFQKRRRDILLKAFAKSHVKMYEKILKAQERAENNAQVQATNQWRRGDGERCIW